MGQQRLKGLVSSCAGLVGAVDGEGATSATFATTLPTGRVLQVKGEGRYLFLLYFQLYSASQSYKDSP
jgi:hypothetical protein